jgi:CheY-like chemotaxis protein
MMPVLSGWEVCREIRSFSQTPILILSVIQEEDLLLQAINDGATGYINKPITKSELISYLQELTNTVPNSPSVAK